MIGCYKIWVLFSYVGLLFTSIATYFSIYKNHKIAILFLMFAGVIDIFDGKVAKKFKRNEKEKQFGIEIDSIIDTISFGVVPIIVYFNLGLTMWFDYMLMFLYLFAVTMRLAYFNTYLVNEKGTNKNYELYIGFPVTSITLFLPLFYIFYLVFNNAIFMRIGFLISIILFLMKLKIKRYKSMVFNVSLIIIGLIILGFMMWV